MKTIHFFSFLIISLLLSFSEKVTAQNQTWEPVSVGDLPANYVFTSMSVVDENVVWAVANVFNFSTPVGADHIIKIMRTTNGGQAWHSYDVEEAMGRISWDISAVDSATAWISSNRLEATDTRPLFKTTDGGESWEQVELDNMSGGVFVHFFDAQHGLVVRNARVAVTNDGGDNWTAIPPQNFPLGTGEFFIMINISAGNHNAYLGSHAWLGSNAGRVFHSADYGLTWTATQVGATNENVISVAFTDTLHGVAAIIGSPDSKLFETFDGGATWTQGEPAAIHLVTLLANVPGAPNTFLAGNNYNSSSSINTIALNQNGITDSTWVYNTDDVFYSQTVRFTSPTSGYAAGFNADGTNVIQKWNGDLSPPPSAIGSVQAINSSIHTFPSPFTEWLNVQVNFEKPSSGMLEVCDINGSLFFSEKMEKDLVWARTIAAEKWPAGIYLLKSLTANGVAIQKVLKQ